MAIPSGPGITLDTLLSPISTIRSILKRRWRQGGVRTRSKQAQRSRRQRDLQNAVKPLPTVRERRLTLPLPDDEPPVTKEGTRPQSTNSQSQSGLFSKLPPELRMRIFEAYFSVGIVSIEKDARLRYVNWKPQKRDFLPLLLTCRRAYSEALDMLYTQPEFFFDDYDTICLFASSILPERLNLVQRVSIQWDCICFWVPGMRVIPPYDEYSWYKVWSIIANMKNLQELRVRIWNGPKMNRETELRVFQPMNQVQQTRVFELELPWDAHDEEHKTAHACSPFRITRVNRRYDPD